MDELVEIRRSRRARRWAITIPGRARPASPRLRRRMREHEIAAGDRVASCGRARAAAQVPRLGWTRAAVSEAEGPRRPRGSWWRMVLDEEAR
jgi:hypothetical protein